MAKQRNVFLEALRKMAYETWPAGKPLPRYWAWDDNGDVIALTRDNHELIRATEAWLEYKAAMAEHQRLARILGINIATKAA
jgi:hypothetical protein